MYTTSIILAWCLGWESNPQNGDFKSPVFTNLTTQTWCLHQDLNLENSAFETDMCTTSIIQAWSLRKDLHLHQHPYERCVLLFELQSNMEEGVGFEPTGP